MWDEITQPFPSFNVTTVEVGEWMSNFTLPGKPPETLTAAIGCFPRSVLASEPPHSPTGVGEALRFIVVDTIGKEERPQQGQFWKEQYLISLKYWPI